MIIYSPGSSTYHFHSQNSLAKEGLIDLPVFKEGQGSAFTVCPEELEIFGEQY